jgi:hypothetical protein
MFGVIHSSSHCGYRQRVLSIDYLVVMMILDIPGGYILMIHSLDIVQI